jgi:aminopeptidase-like protein
MTTSLLQGGDDERRALFWVLSLADGRRDVGAIAEHAGLPLETVGAVARTLEAAGIIFVGDRPSTERRRA